MGIQDKMKNLLKGHEDQAGQGISKPGDFVEEKSQGKYGEQVEAAQQKLKDQQAQEAEEDTPPQA
ncbi:antitoxin [Streptomyces phaeochromogenes]|uniref:antitoxin n=1 Tax=Streptomyces phaeochromogenes TaxID=1923 RepID=UPI003710596D